jgi:hypothetical protein
MTVLWRFRSFLPKDRPEELRRALLEGSLYAPCPDDFNDPYDCLPAFEVSERPISEQQKRARRFIQRYRIPPPLDDVLLGAADRGILNQPQYLGQVLEWYLKDVRRTPILSFFPSPTSPAMWAYYGNSGLGYVLGVDFSTPLANGAYPLPVEYNEERPVVDFSLDHLESEEMQQRLLCDCFLTKDKVWEKENEHRLILVGRQVGYVNLGQERITDICFGWRASDELIEEACALASRREHPLRLYRVVSQERDYGLQAEPLQEQA